MGISQVDHKLTREARVRARVETSISRLNPGLALSGYKSFKSCFKVAGKRRFKVDWLVSKSRGTPDSKFKSEFLQAAE